jgi:hypothetical protein
MTMPAVDRTLFLVRVTQQGTLVAIHSVEAPNALSAINLVEPFYGEPVQLERVSIEDETGSRHEVTVVNNWHGFMFQAQVARPGELANTELQPNTKVMSRSFV